MVPNRVDFSPTNAVWKACPAELSTALTVVNDRNAY
jgi:hypothetical protein